MQEPPPSDPGQTQTDADRLGLILEGLEFLDQGVTVFDQGLHLLAWNRRFQQLLDYPDGFLRWGMGIGRIFRYNAERGEYGPGDVDEQVRQRLILTQRFEPHRMERQRANGTVLEIIGTPLPTGGFITTYTDVTWRKRREQELEQRVAERTRELQERELQLTWQARVLQTVVENIKHGISYFGPDLRLILANQHFLDITRFDRSFAEPGTPFEAFMRINAERGEYGPGDIDTIVRERVAQARHMQAHRFERVRPDGSALEVVGTPLPEGGFITSYTDITERKRIEAQLIASEARLRGILEASSVGVAVSSQDSGFILFSNARLAEMFGTTTQAFNGTDAAVYWADAQRRRELIRRCIGGETVADQEVEMLRPDGSRFWVLVTLKQTEFMGQPCLLAWLFDISEQRRVRVRLDELAHQDPLTGLSNRRSLERELRDAARRVQRHKSLGALLFIDLDGFKQVNDTRGHEVGDALLRELAQRLQAVLRERDHCARVGGDEFAVLLENIAQPQDAQAVGEKLCAELSRPCLLNGQAVAVGASIGVKCFGPVPGDPAQLLKQADRAMYAAKEAGKGCVRVA